MSRDNDLTSNVHGIRDLIDYQTGSVVSRTLIDQKEGTVTVFAFDQGEGLSEHSAPFDALVTLLEGRARISIGGRPHEMGKDDMIIMPADIPHAVEAVEAFKMLLVMIRSA